MIKKTASRWDRTPAGPAQRVPLLAFAPKICSLVFQWKGASDHPENLIHEDKNPPGYPKDIPLKTGF